VHIRPADVTDADSVFELLRQFATSHPVRRATFDRDYEPLLSLTYDGTDLLVADEQGEVVGYALATRSLVLYAGGPVCELQELVVAPAHRNKGVGTALLKAIIARARAAGAVEVTVPTRRATDYYRALGFEEAGTFLKLPLT